jgi:hypothetical protein
MALFGFLKRKRVWSPPEPRCIFMVACASTLPSASALLHPQGEGGAMPGTFGPKPKETLEPSFGGRPLRPGDAFMARSTGGAAFLVSVEDGRSAEEFPGRALTPEAWPFVKLNADLARRAREAKAVVIVMLVTRGQNLVRDILFATRLADRISVLGDGCANDLLGCRFFGSGSWQVEQPVGELDAREHIVIHAESGDPAGLWVHTHGLIKFGRPEFEIYGVPEAMWKGLSVAFLDLAMYVIGGALVKPGDTIGAPDAPLAAREGTRHRKGHWEECPVLELVDVDAARKPVEQGALRGIGALLKSRGA